MDKRLQRVDNLMKEVFGNTVQLVEYYGPVQMCVFGLTYIYLPTNEKIVFECERGAITVRLVEKPGNEHYPGEQFKESRYTHWEDNDHDLQELVCSVKRLFEIRTSNVCDNIKGEEYDSKCRN